MNSATGKAWELGPVAAAKEKRAEKKHPVRVARPPPPASGWGLPPAVLAERAWTQQDNLR